MALFETYLDESDGPILGVAAYVFETDACKALDLEWKTLLDDFDLPYFHMVDCVHHNPPFDKLTLEGCINAEKRAIKIIRDHMLVGTVTTVDERDYNTWMAREQLGTAYSYCCWQTISALNFWMNDRGIEGDIAYFFEAGHAGAGEANDIMREIGRTDVTRKSNRYASHSFVDKKKVRPVQTPDLRTCTLNISNASEKESPLHAKITSHWWRDARTRLSRLREPPFRPSLSTAILS